MLDYPMRDLRADLHTGAVRTARTYEVPDEFDYAETVANEASAQTTSALQMTEDALRGIYERQFKQYFGEK